MSSKCAQVYLHTLTHLLVNCIYKRKLNELYYRVIFCFCLHNSHFNLRLSSTATGRNYWSWTLNVWKLRCTKCKTRLRCASSAVELCVFILDRDKFPNKGGLMRCLPGCLDNKRAIGSAPALPQYQTNSGQDGFWMKLNATPFPPYLLPTLTALKEAR